MQLRTLTSLLKLALIAGAMAGDWSQPQCRKAANKMDRKGCAAPPELLGVQVAASCTLQEDDSGTFLILTGVADTTTIFTDRPYRNAATVATSAASAKGTEAFSDGDGAPNAVVAGLVAGQGTPARFVIQLRAPTYDAATGSLTYHVQQSASQQAVAPLQLGVSMASCSVFIE